MYPIPQWLICKRSRVTWESQFSMSCDIEYSVIRPQVTLRPLNKRALHQRFLTRQYTTSYILYAIYLLWHYNSSPPGQNGRHFADDIFNHIFLNANIIISIQIALKCVPTGPIRSKSTLVQVMAWATNHYLNQCWPSSQAHTWGTRRIWVNHYCAELCCGVSNTAADVPTTRVPRPSAAMVLT